MKNDIYELITKHEENINNLDSKHRLVILSKKIDNLKCNANNLSYAIIKGTYFNIGEFIDCIFNNTSMVDTFISDGQFSNCSFEGAMLTNSVLSEFIISNSTFSGCNMDSMDLSKIHIICTTFINICSLHDVSFSGSRLRDVIFSSGTELRGSTFNCATGIDVSFAGCDLRGCNFNKSIFKSCDFSGADLRGASFCGADLGLSNLKNVKVDNNTDFRGTNFLGCTLDLFSLDKSKRF